MLSLAQRSKSTCPGCKIVGTKCSNSALLTPSPKSRPYCPVVAATHNMPASWSSAEHEPSPSVFFFFNSESCILPIRCISASNALVAKSRYLSSYESMSSTSNPAISIDDARRERDSVAKYSSALFSSKLDGNEDEGVDDVDDVDNDGRALSLPRTRTTINAARAARIARGREGLGWDGG